VFETSGNLPVTYHVTGKLPVTYPSNVTGNLPVTFANGNEYDHTSNGSVFERDSSSEDDATANEDNSVNSISDTDSSDTSDATDDNGSGQCHATYSAEDFVIVKFLAKKSVLHYVAELIKLTDEGNSRKWTVKFLRKQLSSSIKFIYSTVDQIYEVNVKDFVLKLPPPDSGAKRHIVFSGVDFAQYNGN